jgi:hypothetical protein
VALTKERGQSRSPVAHSCRGRACEACERYPAAAVLITPPVSRKTRMIYSRSMAASVPPVVSARPPVVPPGKHEASIPGKE